jgi:hypothetical protein
MSKFGMPAGRPTPTRIHTPGGTIGSVGDRFTAGNTTGTGSYYAPTGSYFECTGRERKIGPSYGFASRHNGTGSVATGPRVSELPKYGWAFQGKTAMHTDRNPVRRDVRGGFYNFTGAKATVYQAEHMVKL